MRNIFAALLAVCAFALTGWGDKDTEDTGDTAEVADTSVE